MSQLQIDGWGVAQADLERSWGSAELPDRCWLFRSPTSWTLVTMRRRVRYDDYSDQPTAGSATITSQAFSALDAVAAEVERTYTSGSWTELLDAGYEHDADLYRAWVPEAIRRDFDHASIHRKDLALYTGLFAGDPVPAPGRQLRNWESEAVEQMAGHLVELGFEVLDERPAVDDAPNDWGDPLLGALRVRRYGWEAAGVVRVDSTGEVFIRLDPDAVAGPLLRPVPDQEW
ncbi:MAG: hypothetical protein KY439_12300 [Actinobacteria bacterium]|nr:hypothetical protein [Actinomycetota bacterium]